MALTMRAPDEQECSMIERAVVEVNVLYLRDARALKLDDCQERTRWWKMEEEENERKPQQAGVILGHAHVKQSASIEIAVFRSAS